MTNRHKRLSWVLALVCAPLVSSAQIEAGGVLEPEPEAPAEDLVGGEAVHRVVPGDTLWDLSERYLGSPWHWPRVWSYNPEIENPHWIFPGDRVRLAPAAPVPVVTEEEPVVDDVPVEVPEVATVGQIGYHGRGRRFRTEGIISRGALEETAIIESSFEEKELLVEGDRVYLAWPKHRPVQVGQVYVVFRPEGKIYHPVTDAYVGHFTRILGAVRVVDASPFRKHVTGMIVKSFEEIERGDRIGPSLFDLERPVAERPNPRNLVGRITATLVAGIREIGQDQVVFLDRGREHGVQPGNRFVVVHSGDGLELPDEAFFVSELPAEAVAELLVIEVQETTSAAVVVMARREFQVGDRVVMRATSR